MSEPGDGGWLGYAADGCTDPERLTMMAADLQAAREEKRASVLKLALMCALLRVGESDSGDT